MIGEPAEWMQETERTCSGRGKKPFRCEECCGIIQPGQRYVEIVGKWNGEVSTLRLHTLCNQISKDMRDWLAKNAGRWDDEMPAIGALIETTVEEVHENGGASPAWWPAGVAMTHRALAVAAGSGGTNGEAA
jgi:hypothetical protein